MKKLTVLFIIYNLTISLSFAQNVGINTTGATPDPSALLDIDAAPLNNKGFLIPRVALSSTTDAVTIATPAVSLLVYNTATISDVFPGYYYWNGTIWVRMINTGNSNGTDWSLTGNAGILSTNFIGTTTAADFKIRTNNLERMTVEANGNVGIGTATPGRKLTIAGGAIAISNAQPIYFAGASDANWQIGRNIVAATGEMLTSNTLQVKVANGANQGFQVVNSGNFSLFEVDGNMGKTYIKGNTGIGTTAPATKLHVVGITRISTLAGTGNRMVQSNTNGDLINLATGTASQVLLGTGVWGSVPTNTAWSLTGNTGTTAGTNFLGTTDAQDLVFKTNNTENMRISNTNGNVGIGTATPSGLLTLNAPAGTSLLTLEDNGLTNPFKFYMGTSFAGYTNTTGILYFELLGTETYMFGGHVIPDGNATGRNLGAPNKRWDTLFVANARVSNLVGAGNRMVQSNTNGDLINLATGTASQVLLGTGVWGSVPTNTAWSLTGNTGTTAGTNFLGTTDAKDLVFKTNNTENMRISNTNGNVGIGTVTPNQKLDVKGVLEVGLGSRGAQLSSTVSDNFQLRTYTNTPNPNLWIGYGDGIGGIDNTKEHISLNWGQIMLMNGTVGIGTTSPTATLSVNGSANKPGGGSWTVFSDKRLKTNINDYNDGLNILDKVHLVNFQYNNKYFNLFGESNEVRKSTYQGVIAQELQKIAPYMVAEKTVEVKDTTGQTVSTEKVLEVDPSAFTYMLINAVKELKSENETINKQNEDLSKEIALIKKKIGL